MLQTQKSLPVDWHPAAQADPSETKRRQRLVPEVSRIFLKYTGPDEAELLRRVVRCIGSHVGDWCAFSLAGPDGLLQLAAERHPDPRRQALAECFLRIMTLRFGKGGRPEANAFHHEHPVVCTELTDEMLRASAPSEEAFQAAQKMGLKSILFAPLRCDERLIGMLILASHGPRGRRYDESDIELASEIADRAALAVRNARLTKALAQQRGKAAALEAEIYAIFDTDRSILCLLDTDDHLKLVSPMFAKLMGDSRERLVGSTAAESIAHFATMKSLRNRDEIVSRFEQIVADRSLRLSEELVFDFVNGARAHLWLSTEPILSPTGAYLGRFIAYVDVTQEREQNERRAEFLTVASHELRTPLTPLAMHLNIMGRNLQRGSPIDPALVAKAARQITRLTRLIDDLIDVSRFESGRFEFNFERLDMGELVAEVISDFRLAHPGRAISVHHPKVPLMVEGDRTRLEQVLVNLVQNALKYSPPGSPIDLRLEPLATELRISVTDEGIGIPLDEHGHLFERFFRARNTQANNYAGLGMGLFICRQIVLRHQGRFEVQSAPDHGATFSFYLPLAAPVQQQEAPAPKLPSRRIAPERA